MEDPKSDAYYANLWWSLTDREKNYIASQFCHENGLEDWREVLAKKEKRERLAKGRAILRNTAIVIVLALLWWMFSDYSNARDSRSKLKYIYGRRSDNPALNAGLKWIDNEPDMMDLDR